MMSILQKKYVFRQQEVSEKHNKWWKMDFASIFLDRVPYLDYESE